MNFNVPDGTVKAAQALVAAGQDLTVHQVHQVVLRDVDANEEKPRLLTLIPIGDVIGVAITEDGVYPKDGDILWVSAAALATALPALGFTVRAPAAYLVTPAGPAETR